MQLVNEQILEQSLDSDIVLDLFAILSSHLLPPTSLPNTLLQSFVFSPSSVSIYILLKYSFLPLSNFALSYFSVSLTCHELCILYTYTTHSVDFCLAFLFRDMMI